MNMDRIQQVVIEGVETALDQLVKEYNSNRVNQEYSALLTIRNILEDRELGDFGCVDAIISLLSTFGIQMSFRHDL